MTRPRSRSCRALPLTDASTRALLGMPHGPAGTDKAAAEQKLLDTAMEQYPHLFAEDRIWIIGPELSRRAPDRPAHGPHARADPAEKRYPAEKDLARSSPDGSYLAEISGDGVTVTVRVIEYCVDVEGQDVPEMFCLVTDLMDIEEYPAAGLAALYKWRWDGSDCATRRCRYGWR